MTAPRRWGAVRLTARLRIDAGQHPHPWAPDHGTWIRYPTADYQCYQCGFTDSASGPAAVIHFVAAIRTRHRAECPRKDTA